VSEAETLIGIAEVSIGLAGFSGVVAALQAQGHWNPWDRLRTGSLLAVALGALVLSLLPVVLDSLGMPGERVWRLSSVCMLGYGLIYAAVTWRAARRAGRHLLPYSRAIEVIFFAIGITNIALQSLNSAIGEFGLFLAGLVLFLVFGGIQFAGILFQRPTE
jgi:hypothetical protein